MDGGSAAFEADYIRDYLRAEAQTKTVPVKQLTVAEELAAEHDKHQQRQAAIDATARNETVKEQLSELELERHDKVMRRLTGASQPTDPNVVEI